MEKRFTLEDETELRKKILQNFLKPIAEQDHTLSENLSAYLEAKNKSRTGHRGLEATIDVEKEKQIAEDNRVN